jgi:hypothetical protein
MDFLVTIQWYARSQQYRGLVLPRRVYQATHGPLDIPPWGRTTVRQTQTTTRRVRMAAPHT